MGEDQRDPHQAFVKPASFPKQAVVAQAFAVVAGEDDHGVVPLSSPLKLAQDSGELVVYLPDHGVVEGLLLFTVEDFGMPRLRLEEYVAQLLLPGQVAVAEMGTGHIGRIELIRVYPGWDQRFVGTVGIEHQHPGHTGVSGLVDELQGAFGDPGRLVEFGRHPVFAESQGVEVAAAFAYPVAVIMAFRPVVPRRVAEAPEPVAVVHAGFCPLPRALEVKLARQAAVISAVCQQFGDQGRRIHKGPVAVAAVVNPPRVHAGHETRAAGCADRTLAVRSRESDAFLHQSVERRRAHVGITERADGVETLLIRAVPEYVGACGHVAMHPPP